MVAWIFRQIQLQLLAKFSKELSHSSAVHSVAKETAKLQHEGYQGAQKLATAAAVEVSKDVSQAVRSLRHWWDGGVSTATEPAKRLQDFGAQNPSTPSKEPASAQSNKR